MRSEYFPVAIGVGPGNNLCAAGLSEVEWRPVVNGEVVGHVLP